MYFGEVRFKKKKIFWLKLFFFFSSCAEKKIIGIFFDEENSLIFIRCEFEFFFTMLKWDELNLQAKVAGKIFFPENSKEIYFCPKFSEKENSKFLIWNETGEIHHLEISEENSEPKGNTLTRKIPGIIPTAAIQISTKYFFICSKNSSSLHLVKIPEFSVEFSVPGQHGFENFFALDWDFRSTKLFGCGENSEKNILRIWDFASNRIPDSLSNIFIH